MIKAFLPHLLERPSGHVLNISRMGGFLPVPGQSIYGASKAAVKLLTEALHSELTDTNVRVIFPGAIGTDISKNSGLDAPTAAEAEASGQKEFKTTSPQDATRMITEAVEADKVRATIGKDAAMMDRLSRLMPERAAALIYKQMKSLLAG